MLRESSFDDLSSQLQCASTDSLLARSIIERFEAAWQRGERPVLEDYLSAGGTAFAAILSQLVHIDLEYRLKAGEPARVETYLKSYPELAADRAAALDLMALEFRFRKQREPGLSEGEFVERFPEYHRDHPTRNFLPAGFDAAGVDPEAPTHMSVQDSQPAEPVQDPTLPNVPGYVLMKVLGRGGLGVVYKACQEKLKRLVALKMILAGKHAGAEQLQRFLVEARAVARLQHPNIVQIHEIGEQDGRPYFSLEYVDGGSLDKRLAGNPQPVRLAAELLETLARAMHAAHGQGIVHRDLKPANVLLAGAAELPLGQCIPKISDFGLAKQLDEESGHTQSGAIMGTPSYMAPEQAQGQVRAIGPPTDVYALGAILYEMLTGQPPFRGASVIDTLEQVREREPVPPAQLRPKLPRDLETICLKCLEKDSARRYASALALADDLRRFLGGETIEARPAGPGERLLKWARRRPALAGLLAVSCLAALFVAVAVPVFFKHQADSQRAIQLAADEVQKKLQSGEEALAAGDYEGAIVAGRQALQTLDLTPALNDTYRDRANRVVSGGEDGVNQKKAHARVRQESSEAYRQFALWRDDALFHASLFTGLDPRENLEKARESAQAALDLFSRRDAGTRDGAGVSTAPALVFNRWYNELSSLEQAEIKADCYELLVVLAGCLEALSAGAEAQRERARAQAMFGRDEAEASVGVQAVDHFLQGNDYYRRGQLPQALASFNQAARMRPKRFWPQYFLAVCYLRTKQLGQAESRLDLCLTLRPQFAWCFLMRADVHAQLGREAQAEGEKTRKKHPDKAEPFLEEAERRFQNAGLDLHRAQQLAADDRARIAIAVLRGKLLIWQKKYEEAVAELRRAVQLGPGEFQAHLDLANAYFAQKKWDESAAALADAVRLQPRLPALYRTRAQLWLARKQPAAALADLDEALRLEPDSKAAANDQFTRARIFHEQKKYAEAVAAFDAAIALRPDFAKAHLERGEAWLRQAESAGDPQKKRALYEKTEQAFEQFFLHASEDDNLSAVPYLMRAAIREKLGKYDGAVEDCTSALKILKALRLEPDPEVYASRGRYYLLLDVPKLALQDFERALKLNPANGDWYNGRGYARARIGSYREAVADAEEALRRGPATMRLWYHASRIYAQAVARIDADLNQQNNTGLQTRSRYQDQALRWLRQALTALPKEERAPFWRDQVKKDIAFDPIRRVPDFKKLAGEYER